jgi:imidazolonepropionase
MKPSLLVHRISRLYTLDPDSPELGECTDTSVAFEDGELCWIGPSAHAPSADRIVNGRGLIGLPGLVDPHTHAVWAGSRSDEFARRLAGESYTSILEGGGGILSTVRATRAASREELARDARARVAGLRAHGVTTVEIKSGYGLEPQTEARMLAAAGDLADTVRVVPTFLGAHAIPMEFRGDREAYIEQILTEQLPLCAPLAACIDVYCDRGAFSLDESLRILEAGKALGLTVRAHAEQVEFTGIAAAAAELGATSVDHLERIDREGIETMAKNDTVAVLLPGAQLYLKDASPPVDALREAGVSMALGTDLNPGSSPVHNPWTIATLACLLQGLTIDEAIVGMTRSAGLALGRPDLGWLGPGSVSDLVLFAPPPGEPDTVSSMVQHMGAHQAVHLVMDGQLRIEDGRTLPP